MKKILALLLAMAMLLSLAACSGDKDKTGKSNPKETAVSPQTVAEEYVKAAVNGEFATTEQYLLYDPEAVMTQMAKENGASLDEVYANLSEEAGQNISSWKDMQDVAKKMFKEELTAEHGEGYTVSVAVVEAEPMTLEELETAYGDILERAVEWAKIDTQDISEGRIYQVEATVDGSNESEADVAEVVLVNYKGSWKVLTPDMSLMGLVFGY